MTLPCGAPNSSLAVPGDTIGILGSGQLGRMLALAAARLDLKVHIFAPEIGPANEVASVFTVAAYEDEAALSAFAAGIKLVTYEFENVPAGTAQFLGARLPVLPPPAALATSQDRLLEKQFLNGLGIETAPFIEVNDAGSLARAVAQLGRPSILKTRRFGYDGKGQVMIREGSDLAVTYRSTGSVPCILEGVVPFTREVSVIGARSSDGDFTAWDVCENQHENHILAKTLVPAEIEPESADEAIAIARKIAEGLDYVGVLAVEMFAVEQDTSQDRREQLIVNEIAPRVHNSGHWTIDGARTCQFEQHIRAICGWPLGSTVRHGRIEMCNLIGDQIQDWRKLAGERDNAVHIYGKEEARPGRKMGHITRIID